MGILHIAVGLVCLVGCVQPYSKEIVDMYLNKFSGEAVYYGKTQEGDCQYGANPPPVAMNSQIRYLVGLNTKQYAESLSCGMCLRVRATGEGEGHSPIVGDFLVFVNGVCGGCQDGGIDLVEDGDGHWGIEVEAVQCPVEDTKIEYKFEGSTEWFLRLQVRNARVPIEAVHVLRDGEEVPMDHTSDGFWELGNGQVTAPLHIKLTAVTDETVSDVIPSIENGHVIQGDSGAQFSLSWDLPGK